MMEAFDGHNQMKEVKVKLTQVPILHCNDCPRVFINKKELDHHILSHNEDLQMFDSFMCLTTYKVLLSRDKIYECNECTRGFISQRERQVHIVQHEKERVKQMKTEKVDPRFVKKFSCERCDMMFVQESTLRAHDKVHEPLPHICHCGMKYRLEQDYLMHKKIIHSEHVEIPIVKRSRNVQKKREDSEEEEDDLDKNDHVVPAKKPKKNIPEIYKSMTKLPPGKRKQCKKCKKFYTHKFYFLHTCSTQKHRDKTPKVSYKTESEGEAMEDDEDSNDSDKPKKVKKKNKTKTNSNEPKKSKRNKDSNEKKNYCNICDKYFSQSGALQIHMKFMHNPDSPRFPCGFCGKDFKRPEGLRIHEKIHLNIKDKVCKYCNKGFTDQSAKQRHERIHTGEKRYKCDVCTKAFREAGTLSKHKLIHIGVKNFECDECCRKFYTMIDLRSHKVRFHMDKYYKCDICKKKMRYKNNLAKHLKTMHAYLFETKHSERVVKTKLGFFRDKSNKANENKNRVKLEPVVKEEGRLPIEE